MLLADNAAYADLDNTGRGDQPIGGSLNKKTAQTSPPLCSVVVPIFDTVCTYIPLPMRCGNKDVCSVK